MSETLTINFGDPIPLFPLPNCVLLPHATIPLHIFEERYRQMVSDAVDGPGLIGMAIFEGDAWKQEYAGSPPVRDNVCIGYIVRHERLQDGRYNILLQGLCRARVVEEVAQTPYRRALLEPIESNQPMEIDLGEIRGRLEALLNDPLLLELASVNAIQKWLSSEVPTRVLIDLALMAMCDDLEQRYDMLAETRTEKRGDWLEHRLRDTRRTLAIAQRFEPEELPDHLTVN